MKDITKDSLYRISGTFCDESERSAVILAATLLEDQLGSLLDIFLVPDKSKVKMFATYAPLSTFSARIEMAYLLGLIPEDVRHDLNYIRKIRNHFAHKIENVSFNKSPVSDLVMNLLAVEWFLKGMSIAENPPTQAEIKDVTQSARRRFEISVGIVSIVLDHYLTSTESRNAKKNQYIGPSAKLAE